MKDFSEESSFETIDLSRLHIDEFDGIEMDEFDESKVGNEFCLELHDNHKKDTIEEYSTLDYEYHQAKDSIDLSRSKEEREYWIKRADSIWKQRDEKVMNKK